MVKSSAPKGLITVCATGASEVVENASIIDGLGADSLDTIELVMTFEEEFGCEIPGDAAGEILTIKDIIDFIEAKISKNV